MTYREIRNEFAELLYKSNLTIGVAEFGTNGEITRMMRDRFDDETFHGGLVCYSAKAARNVLGFSMETAQKLGIHSVYTTGAMAEQARKAFVCDIAVSVVFAEDEDDLTYVTAGFLIGGEFHWKKYEIPEADCEEMTLTIASMRILREMEKLAVEYYGE